MWTAAPETTTSTPGNGSDSLEGGDGDDTLRAGGDTSRSLDGLRGGRGFDTVRGALN